MTDEATWKQVVDFVDQSPSFAIGFTCGQLYRRMKCSEPEIEETVATDCVEQLKHLADWQGYTFAVEPVDPDPMWACWSVVTMHKNAPAKREAPPMLSVVPKEVGDAVRDILAKPETSDT